MFKVKTIVLSLCSAFAIAGCAALEQASDKPAQGLTRPERPHSELTAEELYRAGRQYQGEVRYDRAIAAYLEALERDHNLADAHNALGAVYAAQGRYNDAITEFKAAIELKPGEAYLHNNLGYVLLLQGSTREAIGPLAIAVKLEPSNEKAAFNLRLANERLGNPPRDRLLAPRAASETPGKTPENATGTVAAAKDTHDPRLITVAPNVYELRLPMPAEPQIARVNQESIDEKPLQPPVEQKMRPFRLEVSNGNGTAGLARRVARLLNQNGIRTSRITNHATFQQTTSQIQYRKEYLAEASSLREMFPAEMKVVSSSSLRSDIQVRVLLGKDAVRMSAAHQQAAARLVAAHDNPLTSR